MSEAVRATLLAKQREISALVADLTAVPETNASLAYRNRGDRSRLGTERHAQAATLRKFMQQTSEIERALTKLHDGTYGQCDRCGTQIPQERLDIHPWASLCVPCAARA